MAIRSSVPIVYKRFATGEKYFRAVWRDELRRGRVSRRKFTRRSDAESYGILVAMRFNELRGGINGKQAQDQAQGVLTEAEMEPERGGGAGLSFAGDEA